MSQAGLQDPGQAAGSQAQVATYLKLFTRLVTAAEAANRGNPYAVTPWTGAGDLDLTTAFPSLSSGTISIRQITPAAIAVALKTSGGPWTIVDGAGVAAADNITVTAPVGFTINGAATFVISTNWGSATFVLDGNNYIVVSQ